MAIGEDGALEGFPQPKQASRRVQVLLGRVMEAAQALHGPGKAVASRQAGAQAWAAAPLAPELRAASDLLSQSDIQVRVAGFLSTQSKRIFGPWKKTCMGAVAVSWEGQEERHGMDQLGVGLAEQGTEAWDDSQPLPKTKHEVLFTVRLQELLQARGADFRAVVAAADALRKLVCGDEVTYVVNRKWVHAAAPPATPACWIGGEHARAWFRDCAIVLSYHLFGPYKWLPTTRPTNPNPQPWA